VVTSKIGGILKESINISGEGYAEVKKGDIIAHLDSEDTNRELDKLNARLEALLRKSEIGSPGELDKMNLEAELRYLEKLYAINEYPEGDLLRKKRDLERLNRSLEHEKNQLQLEISLVRSDIDKLLSDREKMEIRAPMDGLLTEFYYLPGATIHRDSSVAKIISKTPAIEISIAEEDYEGIKIGTDVSISLLSREGVRLNGSITALTATSNANTRRRIAFASLENGGEGLSPGMTGQACIIKRRSEDALLIPRKALKNGSVFVVNRDKLEARAIDIGFKNLDFVEVKGGLSSSEVIVAQDVSEFYSKQKVRVQGIGNE
jgi:multidrug efflux pump subunit AcrA (membrane-fusion protein)